LELDIIWHHAWSIFTSKLRKAHIHLMDSKDELVWQFNNSRGQYTTKEGSQALISEGKNKMSGGTKALANQGVAERSNFLLACIKGTNAYLGSFAKRGKQGSSICYL
jgi:hypothetical protein